jgi:RNA polymerase sigma-70 factor (ECF subfamily)
MPAADPPLDAPAPLGVGRIDGSGADAARRARFDAIYAEYFRFVWHGLRRLGVDNASADDAAQDVFLVLHRRLDELDDGVPVKVWLFRVAMHVAKDHRRRARRKGGLDPLDDALPDPGPGPSETAARAEALRTLDRLLDALDDERRAVFVMAEVEQMTAPEIAEVLGVKLNTVYSRLRGARAAFDAAVARHQRGGAR